MSALAAEHYLEVTARRYDAFTERFTIHRDTSRDLVELADVARATRIADLACGTGITTREILHRLGPNGVVDAIDVSPAMLAVARERVTAPNVRWIRGRGEEVDRFAGEPLDLIVCNSALWLMEINTVLEAARRALRSGGRIAFNLPDAMEPETAASGANERPRTLFAAVRAVARERGYDVPLPPSRIGYAEIAVLLAACGFSVDAVSKRRYAMPADADYAYLSIPLVSLARLPGVSYRVRASIVDEAYRRYGGMKTRYPVWAHVVCSTS